jgi:hypothetical protein
MKTITIRNDNFEQSKNMVCINGNYFTFSSKRKLNQFIARINYTTTLWLVELNEIYIQLFVEYRRAWFVMRSKKGHDMRAETVCHTHFDAVANRFMNITRTNAGAYMVFVDLKKICHYLNVVAKELEAMHRLKNNTMPRHAVAIIGKRLIQLIEEINSYKPIQD